VKVYIKLVCILCMGALWRATASMAFCYLFWITTLAWIVRYIIGAKVRGRFFVLMGITSNASVTLLNGGVMPSVGISPTFQPASTIWNVSGKGQWLLLADQAALYRFSIGDMFLIAGLLICLIGAVRFARRREQAPTKVKIANYVGGTVGIGSTGGAITHVLAGHALDK